MTHHIRTPQLVTARLRIIPFSRRHLTPAYVGWLNDPAVVRFSEQRHKRHTLTTCRRYWRSFQGTPHHFWAIETRDGGLGHIGNINAYVDLVNKIADMGILIGEPAARGVGYGTEAWVAVCDFLFHSLGLRKVTAGMMAANTPMIRLARRVGMRNDGRRRAHFLLEGRPVDIVYKAIFRKDWEKKRHHWQKWLAE